jgi:hypothetical protein
MRVDTTEGFRAWLTSKNLGYAGTGLQLRRPVQAVKVTVPERYPRAVVLTDALLGHLVLPAFEGGILYVENHNVWSEEATELLFQRVRQARACHGATLDAAPMTGCDATEYDDFYALNLLAIMGRWDAVAIGESADYGFVLSHGGFVTIYSARPGIVNELTTRGFDFVEA